MKKISNHSLVLFVLLAAFGLTACMRGAPLHNLNKQLVAGFTGQTLSPQQVNGAILAACKKRGWVAREISPGLIEAQLSVRAHQATVQIPYSGSDYSIIYKGSSNLNYDASKQRIHNQYNNWVIYLKNDIDANLAAFK